MKTTPEPKTKSNAVISRQTAGRGGFTLLEIMIVVAIIAILLAIVIPSSVQARTRSQRQMCISHLRQISSAVQQWALEAKQNPNATVDEADITPYIKTSVMCPSGGTSFSDSYTLSQVSVDPVCRKSPSTHVLE